MKLENLDDPFSIQLTLIHTLSLFGSRITHSRSGMALELAQIVLVENLVDASFCGSLTYGRTPWFAPLVICATS